MDQLLRKTGMFRIQRESEHLGITEPEEVDDDPSALRRFIKEGTEILPVERFGHLSEELAER